MNEKSRLEIIYGKENLEKIISSKVTIVGLGGVGSYASEAITRCFVKNITIIDFDKYDISNLNRQLHSNKLTVGKYKVDVIEDNILKINNEANVTKIKHKLTIDNISEFISLNNDYVIDAIDDFKAKVELIDYCKKNSINIISCMGTGNKTKPQMLKYSDIHKTDTCPLARKLRKELKKRNIKKLDVVYSAEKSNLYSNTTTVGSNSFVPATAGLLLASFVINKLVESEAK